MAFNVYYFFQLIAIFIMLGWAVYVNYRNGQLNMAPIYTMAVGAYFSAYAVNEWGWPFGLALVVATAVGAGAGFVPALGLGRAPAFATAIATMGLIYIAQTVIRNLRFLGGAAGYIGIPRIGYLMPVTWGIVIAFGFFIYRLDHSRLGRAMEMVYVDPDVAATLGVNRYWLSVSLHSLAGAMGALAGVFFAFTTGAIQPPNFGFSLLLRIICFVFVGGSTTMWGVPIFTTILWAVTVFLPTEVAEWRNIIYSVLLIVVLLLRPDGVIDKVVTRAIANKSRIWLGQLRAVGKKRVLTEEGK
jgi:branched-chain amino acid transport system permease protein